MASTLNFTLKEVSPNSSFLCVRYSNFYKDIWCPFLKNCLNLDYTLPTTLENLYEDIFGFTEFTSAALAKVTRDIVNESEVWSVDKFYSTVKTLALEATKYPVTGVDTIH